MVEVVIAIVGALGTGVPAYFMYKVKSARMKRDEKLIERAKPEDMPKIARALNPPHELGPWRRKQLEPSANEGQEPEREPQ